MCHSEPYAMRHPERSEGSRFWLRVNSVKNLTKSMRYKTEILRLEPQNDITTQPLDRGIQRKDFHLDIKPWITHQVRNDKMLTFSRLCSRLSGGTYGNTYQNKNRDIRTFSRAE